MTVTVLRFSVVFDFGDAFLSTFARLQRSLLVCWPLSRVCGLRGAHGKTYELGGPKVYMLDQLVRYCSALVGRETRILGLPDAPV